MKSVTRNLAEDIIYNLHLGNITLSRIKCCINCKHCLLHYYYYFEKKDFEQLKQLKNDMTLQMSKKRHIQFE